jgi:hypothetical protein
MASTKDKLEFVYAMAKHSNATVHDCQRLMRYAETYQRIAVEECNRALTEKEIRKQENVGMDIIAICAELEIEAILGGDPRGCTVKIAVPDGYTNDMGREGICVPTS